MEDRSPASDAAALAAVADRLDALADTAELMDDSAGADGLREEASRRRLQAMALLDH